MYQIISDGACDLGETLSHELGVEIVPFYVTMDGELYQKEIEEIKVRDFYRFMIEDSKVFPKSSLPSIQDYINAFEPHLKANVPIVCICITSKFSGSYNSACSAREILLETYQNAKIEVIDSTINTVLQGLLVIECAKLKKAGASYEEVIECINQKKESGRIFFTVGNMDYLVHGGRVGKLAGIAAGTLDLRPLIVLREGEIHSGGLARGRLKSKKKVVEQILMYISEGTNNPEDYSITVGYGYDKEEAVEFRQHFEEQLVNIYPQAKIKVGILQIGATIGVHTGPHPLGFGIIEKF